MQTENTIQKKIRLFYRRRTSLSLIAGSIHLIMSWSVIWISTSVADSIFYFSQPVRWFVLVVNLVISTYLFYRFIGREIGHLIRSRRHQTVLTDIARHIGILKPDIADRLVNAYQLQTSPDTYGSPELRRYAVERYSETIREQDFRSLLSLRAFVMPYTWIICIIIGGISIGSLMGEQLLISLKRVFNPTGTYQLIQDFSITVAPGDTTIIAGQAMDVSATYLGPASGQLRLEIFGAPNNGHYTVELVRKGQEYKGTISGMNTDFIYQIITEPVWELGQEIELKSDRFRVAVITPPAVDDLRIAITPPEYTGLDKHFLEPNTGDILALAGSQVAISARLNKEVRSAHLVFASGDTVPARLRGRSLSATFRIKGSGSYYFLLLDELNIRNTDPINYQIAAVEDLYPVITLIDPGEDIDISPDAALSLLFEGRDDFGFSKLWLAYQILGSLEGVSDSSWQQVPLVIPAGQTKFFQQQFLWHFTSMAVGFGDIIRYYLALTDNDRVQGPKTGYSATYQINFPTIEQVFAASDQKQQESLDENKRIEEASARLKEDLEQITREMKRDKEIDWERQKQISSALNRQAEIQEKLDKIGENLDEVIRKLDQSQMISPEVLEKYQQLQQLFQEIATPELMQAMQSLQDALEKLDDKQIEKSLQDFKLNQEKFAEDVERTLELFRKVQFEQELDRLNKMAEKALRDQERLSETLASRSDPEESLQKQLRQDELLKEMAENLAQILENDLLPRYPEAQDALKQAQDQLSTGEMEQKSRELKEELRSGQQEHARAVSNELSDQLNRLHENIARAQKTILDSDRKNISAQLRKSGADLLDLSMRQENLIDETNAAGSLSDQFKELAGEQQQLAVNMNRVIEDMIKLSRETFMLPPELGQAMAGAGQGMQKSLRELENRNKAGAGNAQKQAMGSLNQAAMQMLAAMQNMSASGSALGFEQFLERMQQMSGQQGQLNEQGLSFFRGQGENPGILAKEAQQQLRRMAAEQRALQESMEQLHEDMGQRSDIPGRLDNLAREMEEVVKDLELQQYDRKTIERQQKILSRMLEAQKSMREQEYSRQRQAEVGKEYVRRSPDPRQEREDRELKRIQDELMRALQEGYTPDYEKIIEEYYRILSRMYLEEKNQKP